MTESLVRGTSTVSAPRRGLVLGGGGILGGAWTVGALIALRDVRGIDPRDFDIIVGTSAGSVLAALLAAGVSVDELHDHQLGSRVTSGPLSGLEFDYEKATGAHRRPPVPRLTGPGSARLIGQGLLGRLSATAMLSGFLPAGTASLERVGHLIDAVTPMGHWSDHPNLWIVAMDYHSGARTVFGREDSPVAPLADVVMASCAIPGWFQPVTIGDRTYVDGGAVSATSVDLLAGTGLDEVIVLAPMVSEEFDHPQGLWIHVERRWRIEVTRRCLAEVEQVRASGIPVTVLGPGAQDLEAIGANLMDAPRRRGVIETAIRTTGSRLRDAGVPADTSHVIPPANSAVDVGVDVADAG